MKKLLFALFFLLFLLILTCVYQKTYTLYANQTEQEENHVVVLPKKQVQNDKKKVTHIQTKTIVKKEVHISKTLDATVPETKVSQETKEPTNQEPSIIQTIKTTVTQAFSTKSDTKTVKSVRVKKVLSHTPEVPKKEMKKLETEAVDYLLTVLKEQDGALSKRDAAESRLHALIKRALEERKHAIETMQNVVTTSENAQTSRLEHRDTISQQITEKYQKGE